MNESLEQPTRRELAVAVAMAVLWWAAGVATYAMFGAPRCEGAGPPAAAICRVQNILPGGETNLGSGTLIDVTPDRGRGLVLSCAHLFTEGVGQVQVGFPSGRSHGALVIGLDQAADLAALEIANPHEPPVELGDPLAPPNSLSACGYGPHGVFRCVAGPVVGAAQRPGQLSLKIGGAVRSGDSGGGVFDGDGRLVGVVWGERDGVTYASSGQPLRQFVEQSSGGRRTATTAQAWTGVAACPNGMCPRVAGPALMTPMAQAAPRPTAPALQAPAATAPTSFVCSEACPCRREFAELASRLDSVEHAKQDRGEYASRDELAAFARADQLQSLESDSRRRHESLVARLKRLTTAAAAATPPLGAAGRAAGAMATTALGVSGPAGWGLVAGLSVGGWLLGRFLGRRHRGVGGRREDTFRA